MLTFSWKIDAKTGVLLYHVLISMYLGGNFLFLIFFFVQVLLFSATFSERVKSFVERTIHNYNQLFVKKEELSLESVKQYKVHCPDELAKIKVVGEKILELGQKLGQTIIFVRTRNSAGYLHRALTDLGYEVTTIQGALTHDDRDKIVKEFKDGLTKVLISTDLLARGFDQSQVMDVVCIYLLLSLDLHTT